MADSVKNDDLSRTADLSDHESHSHSKQPLPSIHPDDARDKVFTAIMKALLKVGNKPSSPRELSNVITKYKYATLGGATPFATVSSRISQHFKRAAEHNPPRAPLLAKHVDQRHARKINYSLITDTIQSESAIDEPDVDKSSKTTKDSEKLEHYTRSSARKAELSDSSPLSSEDEGRLSLEIAHITRSVDKRKRSVTKSSPTEPDKSTARSQRPRRKTNSQYARKPESDHDADEENDHESDHELKPPSKRLRNTATLIYHPDHLSPSSNQVAPTSPSLPPSIITDPPITVEDQEGADSDSEFSDYHEEMLKGDEVMEDIIKDTPTSSFNDKKNSNRRPSLKNTQTGTITSSTSITSIDTAIQSSQPTLASALNPSHISPKSSPRLMGRKSTTNGLLGDDLWLPYSFDQDFDNVFLSDNSCAAHHVPLNIAAPESISVSELDNYFSSTTSGSRKPFMNTSRKTNGCTGDFKGSPLLQKVLQAKQPMTVDNGARPQAGVTEDRKPDQSEVEAMALDEPTSDSNPALETPDDSSIDSSDEDAFQPARPYHIVEKVFGTLRVYELDSPGDIPNTKVMRFIGTTDGSNNNVARRTRNAETKSQKNSQYFYLDEGYVNATQLRKAAQPVLGKGTFDASTENERSGVVVTISTGPVECRGAWIPLNRARELVEEYEIESSLGLTKLLSDEPTSKESHTNGQLEATNGTVSTPPSPRSLENGSQRRASPLATNSALVADSSEELSSEHISSDDDDSFVKFEDAESTPTPTFKPADSVISPNIAPDVATSVATSVPPSKGPTTPIVNSTASLVSAMTTSPATAAAVAAASSNVNSTLLSAVEILKTLNISNLNLQTLHQIAAAIPNLAHLAPTLKSVSNSSTATTTAISKESKLQTPAALDIKSALSHFSTLEALLKKEPSKSPSVSESTPTSPSSKPSADTSNSDRPSVIATTIPTTPHMYITIIDNIAVYVTVLSEVNGVEGEHLLMRRLDNGYINGTTLLKAGGIETEQERSIVLSLEVGRVRIPNRASKLHGTWIPLRRAQALAATCSLQHKLGPFLNDSIDSYFPNPLPISLPVSKKPAESRLTAVTLTSLRNGSGSTKNGLLAHHASAPASPNGTANAQLQQLLLSHPNKSLKLGDHSLKAPMLGSFDDDLPNNNKKGGHKKKKREISVVSCSNHCGGIASPNTSVLSPVTVKSGPTSDTCPSPPLHNLPTPDNDAVSPSSFVDVVNEEASDDDTDTDTDVEEVREHMKKMRAAAIDAMENGSSVDLDEIISRARSPLAYHRESHSQPSRRSQRTKRHRNMRHVEDDDDDDDDDDEDDEDDEDEEEEIPISRPRRTHSNIYQSSAQSNRVNTYGRRRPTGGKWASGGKLAPSMVKKSASWNGSISKSSHIVVPSRRSNATKASDAPAARKPDSTPTKLTLIVPSPVSNKPSAVIEEDEDEEIDIGGSDRDDDLR